jgi:hypothetical protein
MAIAVQQALHNAVMAVDRNLSGRFQYEEVQFWTAICRMTGVLPPPTFQANRACLFFQTYRPFIAAS